MKRETYQTILAGAKILGYTRDEVDRILEETPEDHKHGNCYVEALHAFMEDPQNRVLVHGIVTGQGPIEGVQYGHAWVLDGWYVIDKTLSPSMQRLPKDFYYSIGQIDPDNTRMYKGRDVLKMLDKFGTYGPWDPMFDNYP